MPINYQVKQGDCIFSIAFEHGFFADTIWDHPNNKRLKDERKDPNVLLPGDTVHVPDKRLKELSEPTNEVYKYRCKNTPKILKVQFKYIETPLKDLNYKISVDGKETEGKTDSQGWLKEPISPNAKVAKVTLADGLEYELKLGILDPVDDVSGVQGRLHSLGMYDGPIDGRMNDETKIALGSFQLTNDLEVTGEADDETKKLLVESTGK